MDASAMHSPFLLSGGREISSDLHFPEFPPLPFPPPSTPTTTTAAFHTPLD